MYEVSDNFLLISVHRKLYFHIVLVSYATQYHAIHCSLKSYAIYTEFCHIVLGSYAIQNKNFMPCSVRVSYAI